MAASGWLGLRVRHVEDRWPHEIAPAVVAGGAGRDLAILQQEEARRLVLLPRALLAHQEGVEQPAQVGGPGGGLHHRLGRGCADGPDVDHLVGGGGSEQRLPLAAPRLAGLRLVVTGKDQHRACARRGGCLRFDEGHAWHRGGQRQGRHQETSHNHTTSSPPWNAPRGQYDPSSQRGKAGDVSRDAQSCSSPPSGGEGHEERNTYVRSQTLVPVTSWILGHIFSFQPALPVTARIILPSWARMKRGVASGRDLPSSLVRKAVRAHSESAGQFSSFSTSVWLAGCTTR